MKSMGANVLWCSSLMSLFEVREGFKRWGEFQKVSVLMAPHGIQDDLPCLWFWSTHLLCWRWLLWAFEGLLWTNGSFGRWNYDQFWLICRLNPVPSLHCYSGCHSLMFAKSLNICTKVLRLLHSSKFALLKKFFLFSPCLQNTMLLYSSNLPASIFSASDTTIKTQ